MSSFGRSSEKLAREAEQLELALEALETDQAERLVTASPAVAAAVETANEAQKPARRPLPAERGSAPSSPFRIGPADSSEVGPVQPQHCQVSTAPLPRAQQCRFGSPHARASLRSENLRPLPTISVGVLNSSEP
jgi:hypothetical protein